MSRLSGRFYVPDASQTTDARGRKVISDQEFVSANNIATVFGMASSSVMTSGARLAMLVFSSESVPEAHVDLFQSALPRLRSATMSTLGDGLLFST